MVVRYATLPRERYRATRSEAHMHTAEECRTALQKLAGRLSELSPDERDQYFGNRTISVTIPDLDVTFVSVLGRGDDPPPPEFKDAPVISRSTKELRELIIDWVKRNGHIPTAATNNWRLLPETTQ